MTSQADNAVPDRPPMWLSAGLIPLLQLTLALAATAILIALIGEDPVQTLKVMLIGAFDPVNGLPSTLYYTTSLVFTGLAVSVAFHAGLFNIGGEGQAYIGGLFLAVLCLAWDQTLGPWALFVFSIVAAMAGGALWALLPGVLQARRGAHVVVTTIMFNYIAAALMNFLLLKTLKSPSSMAMETRHFSSEAMLPKVHEILGGWGFEVAPSLLNVSSVLAIVALVLVWWLLWRTRLGYALRVLGQNPHAARYAGLRTGHLIVVAMLISGALAGLMAVNDVYGAQNRLALNFTGGMGFLGIAVALMGRNHPAGVAAAALLFGALYQGSTDLQLEFPRIRTELLLVIQGLIVFFAAALDRLVRAPVEAYWAARNTGRRLANDIVREGAVT